MSMVVYISVGVQFVAPDSADSSKRPFQYTFSVGFGIAYPRMEGSAKA